MANMDTPTLKQIFLELMHFFAGEGFNAYSKLTVNEEEQLYAVIDFSTIKGRLVVSAPLISRLVDDKIYIDRDQNYPSLDERLRRKDVPENQIVLTYVSGYEPEKV